MALESVSERYEGEKPTAAELNELLLALRSLLTSGLPSTAIPWPLVAGGDIDMAGFILHNLGSEHGIIHVNNSTSLSTAIAQVNAANAGGVIVIDPGGSAATAGGGDTITADEVTIFGYGAKSELICTETSSAVPALSVTGDNFRSYGVNYVCDASASNMTAMLAIADTDGFDLGSNIFTDAIVPNLWLGTPATAADNGVISANRFEVGVANVSPIIMENASDVMFGINVAHSFSTNYPSIEFPSTGSCSRVQIRGNNLLGGLELNSVADSEITSNRLFGNISFEDVSDTSVTGNKGVLDLAWAGTNSGNKFDNNEVTSTFTVPTTAGIISMSDNEFTGTLTFASGADVKKFVDNTVSGSVAGLGASGIPLFSNNYITGTVT